MDVSGGEDLLGGGRRSRCAQRADTHRAQTDGQNRCGRKKSCTPTGVASVGRDLPNDAAGLAVDRREYSVPQVSRRVFRGRRRHHGHGLPHRAHLVVERFGQREPGTRQAVFELVPVGLGQGMQRIRNGKFRERCR